MPFLKVLSIIQKKLQHKNALSNLLVFYFLYSFSFNINFISLFVNNRSIIFLISIQEKLRLYLYESKFSIKVNSDV